MGRYTNQHQNQDGHGLDVRDDAIDLFEVFGALFKNFWLITAMTALCTLGALAYSLLATPTYKATAIIGSPGQATLNKIDNAAGIYSMEPELEYERIFQTLINQDLQYRFFLDNIQPLLPEASDETESRRQFETFKRKLSIRRRDKGRGVSHDHITVDFSSDSPEDAYRVLTSFLNFMNKEILKAIAADYSAEVEIAKKTFTKEIDLLLNSKAMNINAEIQRLQESLAMAREMGIVDPAINEGSDFDRVSSDDPATHLLGEKFLASRIKLLGQRKDLIAFTPGVAELKARLDGFDTIRLNTQTVDILKFEKSPSLPHSRISPRRTFIVVLGCVLGIFLGCALVLIRFFVQSHNGKT